MHASSFINPARLLASPAGPTNQGGPVLPEGATGPRGPAGPYPTT